MIDRYRDRRNRVTDRLQGTNAEGLVLGSGPNCQYFTGFRGEDDRQLLVLLQPGREPVAISPSQYTGQVRDNTDLDRIDSVDGNTPTPVVRRLSERVGDPDCLFVDGNVDGDIVICLMERLTATDIQNTGRLVEDLRLYKDRVEIEAMKRAARIADAASEEVRALGGDVIGMTERELAADVRSRLHAKGGERVSFPVTVAAGPNGARPTQYRHGDRKIRPGEPVVIDFGTFESGYASDQTRTSVFSGEPTERFREAYDAVIAGLEAGVEAAEPGVSVATVDAAVRSSIAEYGLEDRFIHTTGHGVGLDAHEPPAVDGNDETELQDGVVFSIEPGVYFDGDFGVRVEDVVAIKDDGSERLNDSTRTWRPLTQ